MTQDEGLSPAEVSDLEDAEYLEAVERLIQTPEFKRVITRWTAETREGHRGPVDPLEASVVSYQRGRAQLMDQFNEWMKESYPQFFMGMQQELVNYDSRRARASNRDLELE